MPSTSSSSLSTMLSSSSHASHSSHPFVTGSVQEQIVRALNIPVGLMDRNKKDLQLAYRKYEAINNVINQINQMVADGSWTQAVCLLFYFYLSNIEPN